MSKSEVNMMFFAPLGYWNERHIRECLEEIKEHGVDSVCSQFYEDPHTWGAMESFAKLAHDASLRFYGMGGRLAGLFAAGPRPCSRFAQKHTDALVVDEEGKPVFADSGWAACLNHPDFENWFYPMIDQVTRRCGIDGMLFDEPKTTSTPCYCPICKEKAGDDTDALTALREDAFATMLNRTASVVKDVNPNNTTLAMLMPVTKPEFVEKVVKQPALDVIGVDGPVCGQKVRKESVFSSAPRFRDIVRKHGKRFFTLIETFEVPESAHSLLDEQMPKLPELNADVYSFNYYAHANDDPDQVMSSVWRGIDAVKG